jgi:hypothetical protein
VWSKECLLLKDTAGVFFSPLQQIHVHIIGRNFQTAAGTDLLAGRSLLIPARGPVQRPLRSWSSYPEVG